MPLFKPEGCGERFFPMGVEIVQHQMNGARRGVTPRDPINCARKLCRGTVFRGEGLIAPVLGSTTQNTLAVPQRAYS
jgi:hypothetical protein